MGYKDTFLSESEGEEESVMANKNESPSKFWKSRKYVDVRDMSTEDIEAEIISTCR